MKRLSLVFALVFAAGIVMAQNTANTHSIGNSNQVSLLNWLKQFGWPGC